ncbi:hypothetical protein [Desulfovibrio sp. Huiquan2017]|uniref:hypothetical protein n=1 Tax=Desulfovibrio sp. Huiquan2017 TaxID=2816861 RepID=UPI001A91FBE5|nr:hypothetical protein [Desulfovibrio sp. Huiquan2017]
MSEVSRNNMLIIRRINLAEHLAEAIGLIGEIAKDGQGLPDEIREAVNTLNNKIKGL